jgi:hypothetical protein
VGLLVCLGSDVSCALRCDLEVVKSREEEIGRPLLHPRFSQNTIPRQPIRTLQSRIQENEYFNISLYQSPIDRKVKPSSLKVQLERPDTPSSAY